MRLFTHQRTTSKSRYISLLPFLLLLQHSAPGFSQDSFVDETTDSGLPLLQTSLFPAGPSVAVFDYDNDGYLDILLTQMFSVELFRNVSTEDTLLFEDVSAFSGFDGLFINEPRGLVVGDFNNDGLEDLFIPTKSQDLMFFNTDSGQYIDVTSTHLPGFSGPGATGAAADFDGDGDLDLYVTRYVLQNLPPGHRGDSNSLLVNDGNGRFVDRTAEYGLTEGGTTLAAIWSDADEDGDLDLLVVNDFGARHHPNTAYRNDGPDGDSWRFTDASEEWGFDVGICGMGIAMTDVNRDGHRDYVMTSIGRQLVLQGPAQDGFLDITDTYGLAATFSIESTRTAWGVTTIDVDNDGIEEIYFRSGAINSFSDQSDALLRIGTPPHALDIGRVYLPDTQGKGRGIIVADIDRNGTQDLIGTTLNGPPQLMVRTSLEPSIHIKLQPTVSAPGAPGGFFRLTCGDVVTIREVQYSGSGGSHAPPGEFWIPFPDCEEEATLTLQWPSSIVQKIEGVIPSSTMELVEPEWLYWTQNPVRLGSVEHVTLFIEPADEEGTPVTEEQEIEVTCGSLPAVIAEHDEYIYYAEVPVPDTAQELRCNITIDGVLLPVHPTLNVLPDQETFLTNYPAHFVGGKTQFLTATVAADATPGLIINGEPVELLSTGEGVGTYSYEVPLTEETVTVQVTSNSEISSPVFSFPIEPQFEPLLSPVFSVDTVIYPDEVTLSSDTVAVIALVRDANGEGLEGVTASDISLSLDGIPFDDSVLDQSHLDTVNYSIEFNRDLLEPGGELTLKVNGLEIGAPINVVDLPDISAVAELIDIDRSILGFVGEGCYGNGSDLIVFEFVPKDSNGNILMILDNITPELTGAVQYTEIFRERNSLTFAAHCDLILEGGTGEVRLLIEDIDIGWFNTFDIYPARFPEVAPELTGLVIEPDEYSVHTPVLVRVTPRERTGYLTGSGVDVGLITDPPISVTPATYCSTSLTDGSFGEYCLYATGPPGGGDVLVEVTLNGEATGIMGSIQYTPESLLEETTLSDMGLDVGLDLEILDVDDLEDVQDYSDLVLPQDLNDQSFDTLPDDLSEVIEPDMFHQDVATTDLVTGDELDSGTEDSHPLDQLVTTDLSPDSAVEQPVPPAQSDGCACIVGSSSSSAPSVPFILLLLTSLFCLKSRRQYQPD